MTIAAERTWLLVMIQLAVMQRDIRCAKIVTPA
jgi:hypothetical protein